MPNLATGKWTLKKASHDTDWEFNASCLVVPVLNDGSVYFKIYFLSMYLSLFASKIIITETKTQHKRWYQHPFP